MVNLEALKALLPEFEGRVKCIYIDPPYNTGNEGWVYNDNVNDPRMQKWLQQVVGKEGEDLTRHDKWLCMMYPRLKLLHKLLAANGSIWVSIDDIEVANLRLVLDEIFGAGNFVGNVIGEKLIPLATRQGSFQQIMTIFWCIRRALNGLHTSCHGLKKPILFIKTLMKTTVARGYPGPPLPINLIQKVSTRLVAQAEDSFHHHLDVIGGSPKRNTLALTQMGVFGGGLQVKRGQASRDILTKFPTSSREPFGKKKPLEAIEHQRTKCDQSFPIRRHLTRRSHALSLNGYYLLHLTKTPSSSTPSPVPVRLRMPC